MISNAEVRRFLSAQKQLHSDCPNNLWQRYRLYVESSQDPIDLRTFKSWINK